MSYISNRSDKRPVSNSLYLSVMNYDLRRVYNTGYADTSLKTNLYVFVAPGKTITEHFLDSEGKEKITISKGRKEMTAGEFVGTTTGAKGGTSSGKILVQIRWVNVWNENVFLGLGNKKVEQEVISYVFAEDVEIREAQNSISISGNNTSPQISGNNTSPQQGISQNSDTLLYAGAGLAAALLLNNKKRKK